MSIGSLNLLARERRNVECGLWSFPFLSFHVKKRHRSRGVAACMFLDGVVAFKKYSSSACKADFCFAYADDAELLASCARRSSRAEGSIASPGFSFGWDIDIFLAYPQS